MEHLDTFLTSCPPFDGLEPSELTALIERATERSFEPGELALVEDGAPSPGVYVVRAGSMELVHEGEVIQVLEPGECFGHPSLLTGMAPAFTVRAREPSLCLLFGPDDARYVFARKEGAAFIASSMRRRLTSAGHTVHGLLDVGTTPISAIMRPPVWCEPDTPVRDAAGSLSQQGLGGALLVSLGDDQLGIVTDAVLRERVLTGDVPLDAPVSAIARVPAPTVPITQIAIEANIDMVAAGSEHAVVLDGGRVAGVMSAADLLGLRRQSPIALRHSILAAADEDALVAAVARLPVLFGILLKAGVPSRDLGRVLSLQHDAIVSRLVDFSIWSRGPAPLTWAWLDLGSAARREFTLASDQDNALAYDRPEPWAEASVDEYFEHLGSDVNAGLVRCGIGVDNNGVMAGRRLWRMSKPDWMRTFQECLTEPNESHLIRASVAFDFRPATGGLEVVAELTDVVRAAQRYPAFMRLMARTAIGYHVALGFRGHLVTDKAGRVDLKAGAIIPLVNVVRFHALANGITISNTIDRIQALASVGGLEQDVADGLREAFDVICRIRFEHHAAVIAAGQAPDNLVDPGALPPIARSDLREALGVVKRAQNRLGAWAPAMR
jgi:CBS domain-containing protein